MNPLPRWQRIAGVLALGAAGLLLLIAAFPWGWLAASAAGPLSRAIGHPVAIGGARRLDVFSFVPTIEFRDVAIAQPSWAGAGNMARIDAATVRLPVLPLLWGELRLRSLDLRGGRLELRRDASGRSNWGGTPKRRPGRRRPLDLSRLTLQDVRVHLVDRKRDVDVTFAVVADAVRGVAARGAGRFHGQPLSVAIRGAALSASSGEPYPAAISVASPLVRITALSAWRGRGRSIASPGGCTSSAATSPTSTTSSRPACSRPSRST